MYNVCQAIQFVSVRFQTLGQAQLSLDIAFCHFIRRLSAESVVSTRSELCGQTNVQ